MNLNHSLADEKQALLAKMQSSRVAYQKMLLGTDAEQSAEEAGTPVETFPRSKTLRWIYNNPYMVAAGVTVAVLASRPTPRRTARSLMVQGRTVSSAFARHQNKIRVALGLATALARFIQSRR